MKLLIISLLLFISSCSNLKRTLIYSAASGLVVGAVTGATLSPDRKNRSANALTFGLVGAAATALIGYALYIDDPRNKKLDPLLSEKIPNEDELSIDIGKIKIFADLKKKSAYKVPVTELPKELRGKVKKQYLIKYETPERYIKKGNKTYYIPSFQILEHDFSDIQGDLDEI